MLSGMLSHNIHISPMTLGKLLTEKRLEVPPSQRSYRWKPEHAEDLFKDMRTAIDDDAEEYFVGSIVSIQTDDRILIYDGQQRLATTMILIAAIRNALLDSGNDKDAGIAERSFLFSERRGGNDADPHFTLNLEDRDYFFNRILPRPDAIPKKDPTTRPKDSHKRMESVAKAAKEFVATSLIKLGSPAETEKNLNKWLDFIEQSLHVIWVQVNDERTAFTIFETMNDRELRLSAADLLKNYLHATAENRRDAIMHHWGSVISVLETVDGEEDNIVEYIRCFWVCRHGHTRTRYLYDKIKERTTNKSKALSLASDLEASVQNYAAIILASHERTADRGESVKSNIAVLKTLGVTQLRPMLLSAFEKFTHGQFDKLLRRSVCWSVRFLISGTPSGTIEGYYAKIAHDIWTGKVANADTALSAIKQILPTDDQFKAAFANASESKERIARYYLHALQKTTDGTIPNHALTLEHILPLKLDGNWKNFTPEEHKAYVHKLGNLALLGFIDNGGVQGTGYATKKIVLADSKNASLTQAAGYYSGWTIENILERQKKLAVIALKTWPVI